MIEGILLIIKTVMFLTASFTIFELGSAFLNKHVVETLLEAKKVESLQNLNALFPADSENQTLEEKLTLATLQTLFEKNPTKVTDRFDIEGNVPLEKAQIILFSEKPTSKNIIIENFRLLIDMIQPGDLIIFDADYRNLSAGNEILTRAMLILYPGLTHSAMRPIAPECFLRQVQADDWDLRKENQVEEISANLAHKRVFIIASASLLPTQYAYKKSLLSSPFGFTESLDLTKGALSAHRYSIVTLKDFDGEANQDSVLEDIHGRSPKIEARSIPELESSLCASVERFLLAHYIPKLPFPPAVTIRNTFVCVVFANLCFVSYSALREVARMKGVMEGIRHNM